MAESILPQSPRASSPHYQDDTVTLHHGDCLDILTEIPDQSVHAVITDPPYGLGFMGKEWDALPPGKEWAEECLRVLKPGGHLLAFGGTRTWHRLTVAVEDAGFEIRDSIAYLYGAGFPKSLNLDNIKNSPFCQCHKEESDRDSDLRRVRPTVRPATESREAGQISDMLAPVQRQSTGQAVGHIRSAGAEEARTVRAALRGSEPSLERRRDAEAAEGQLHGRPVRPLPARVADDGTGGRLHHGTPASDGAVDRSPAVTDGGREPHRPQSVEQSAVEPRTVSVERGPQARGSWPLCERCAQPVVTRGLGTALKPAFEPIVVARKPLQGTVAANVQAHGVGALNIDGCRIGTSGAPTRSHQAGYAASGWRTGHAIQQVDAGRWPANVILDESQAAALDEQSGMLTSGAWRGVVNKARTDQSSKGAERERTRSDRDAESGGASRFFYVTREDDKSCDSSGCAITINGGSLDTAARDGSCSNVAPVAIETLDSRFFYTAKADQAERITHNGIAHPTVKPLDLMRWLVRLVTPPGGTILEPFAGSGTTVEAAILEGFRCIAIEREADYLPLITQRIHRRRDPVKYLTAAGDDLGLFADDEDGAA